MVGENENRNGLYIIKKEKSSECVCVFQHKQQQQK